MLKGLIVVFLPVLACIPPFSCYISKSIYYDLCLNRQWIDDIIWVKKMEGGMNQEKKGILSGSFYYFLYFPFVNTTVDVLQYDLLERLSVKYFLFPHPPKPRWYGFFKITNQFSDKNARKWKLTFKNILKKKKKKKEKSNKHIMQVTKIKQTFCHSAFFHYKVCAI